MEEIKSKNRPYRNLNRKILEQEDNSNNKILEEFDEILSNPKDALLIHLKRGNNFSNSEYKERIEHSADLTDEQLKDFINYIYKCDSEVQSQNSEIVNELNCRRRNFPFGWYKGYKQEEINSLSEKNTSALIRIKQLLVFAEERPELLKEVDPENFLKGVFGKGFISQIGFLLSNINTERGLSRFQTRIKNYIDNFENNGLELDYAKSFYVTKEM